MWRSDGTPSGTGIVLDIAAGGLGSEPVELTAIGDVLYFVADDGLSGIEVWRTDGTMAGTERVADIVGGAGGSAPRSLTAVGDRLFFTADDGQTGRELWVSDGTPLGTSMVSDIQPGPVGSSARLLTAIGSRNVWFAADDGTHGSELWRSDGTSTGTVLVHDLYPSDVSSDISELVLSRGNVLFVGDDGVKGAEPWRVFPGATAQEFGEGCGVLGRTPRLRATDPVLGGTTMIVGSGAVPQLPMFLVIGIPQRPMSVIAAGAGCFLYLDPYGPLALLPVVPSTSRWVTQLDVPAVASLTGDSVVLQAVQGPTGAPLGFDVSNGVLLTMGY